MERALQLRHELAQEQFMSACLMMEKWDLMGEMLGLNEPELQDGWKRKATATRRSKGKLIKKVKPKKSIPGNAKCKHKKN